MGSNGQFRPNYPDAYFGHPNQSFSKLQPLISLHRLQDHILVTILELVNLAETSPSALNKSPKYQSINQNKITSIWELHQTNFS